MEIPSKSLKRGKLEYPILSEQSGLLIYIYYSIVNRKPHLIEHIDFARVSFDSEGIYNSSNELTSELYRVKLNYAMSEIFELIERIEQGRPITPLPLPIAPEIPSKSELQLIKAYLSNKYPVLLDNSIITFEIIISRLKDNHKSQIIKWKKSHKIKS